MVITVYLLINVTISKMLLGLSKASQSLPDVTRTYFLSNCQTLSFATNFEAVESGDLPTTLGNP